MPRARRLLSCFAAIAFALSGGWIGAAEPTTYRTSAESDLLSRFPSLPPQISEQEPLPATVYDYSGGGGMLEACWPDTPNMIGDLTYGALGSGNNGGFGNITRFVGFGTVAAELIPVDLVTNAPMATFNSVGLTENFISINPAAGFTTNTVIALQANMELVAAAQAAFPGAMFVSSQAVPQGLVNQVPGLQGLVPVNPAQFTPQPVGALGLPAGATQIQGNFPGSVAGQDLTLPGGAALNGGELFIVLNTINVAGGNFGLFVPAPGGITQYARVSDNNSPRPQDRVFFNYSYLDNVLNNQSLDFYTFGVEKTFLDGLMSVQVNIPFFGGPDSDVTSVGSSDVEFGNIPVWLKLLLIQRQNLLVSGGLGVNIPSADNVSILMPGVATPVLRVRNDAVHLMPFLAGIYRPSRNLFFQSFVQFDVDTNGNQVEVNQLGQLVDVGTLNAQSLVHIDAGVGYLLYENPCGRIQAVTPMVELHYTADMDNADVVVTGATPIGTLPDYDVLNITGGFNIKLSDRANLNVGAAAPLSDDGIGERIYDWRAMIQLNVTTGGQ